MKNIFVGNLSADTTDEALRSLFQPYGAVNRVTILIDRDLGRSRGFAFVEMNVDAEGDNAIEALNGASLDGRPLNVNVARPNLSVTAGNRSIQRRNGIGK